FRSRWAAKRRLARQGLAGLYRERDQQTWNPVLPRSALSPIEGRPLLDRNVERRMNWLTNVVRPKIRNILRRETPENLWIKCPDSGQLVFYKDVESNQFVIPGSNYHMRMGAVARLKSIFDNETWFDVALPDV